MGSVLYTKQNICFVSSNPHRFSATHSTVTVISGAHPSAPPVSRSRAHFHNFLVNISSIKQLTKNNFTWSPRIELTTYLLSLVILRSTALLVALSYLVWSSGSATIIK